jgi:hypothetical protein
MRAAPPATSGPHGQRLILFPNIKWEVLILLELVENWNADFLGRTESWKLVWRSKRIEEKRHDECCGYDKSKDCAF